jgi:hypothetical protein
MATIAFYFILLVGEYMGHSKKVNRHTKQFRACDITFFDSNDKQPAATPSEQVVPWPCTSTTFDHDKIRKQGRWSSDTFLMHIHEQISAFSAGQSA